MQISPYTPHTATLTKIIQESKNIFTLSLKLDDSHLHHHYSFSPGQFNMLYLFGVGEAAISILSSNQDNSFNHTIRALGRVTKGLTRLNVNEQVGFRGPYGVGWPMEKARSKDVLVITGGLGCAPSVSVIHHILNNRADYGRLIIIQGLKHSDDLIFQDKYQAWQHEPNTEVYLTADFCTKSKCTWYQGRVTHILDKLKLSPINTISMICGPEPMMVAAAKKCNELGINKQDIYISMERNMSCGFGHCGHCQLGDVFVCRNGPVFSYNTIEPYLSKQGL